MAPHMIPAGYVMNVAGQDLPVFGFDRCPENNSFWSLLMGTANAESGCIKIEPETTSVMVMVDHPQSRRAERWFVDWKEQTLNLTRQDGTPLTSADNRNLETALIH